MTLECTVKNAADDLAVNEIQLPVVGVEDNSSWFGVDVADQDAMSAAVS